jgi:hypothetical protein
MVFGPVIQDAVTKVNNYFLSYWIGEITPEVLTCLASSTELGGILASMVESTHGNITSEPLGLSLYV